MRFAGNSVSPSADGTIHTINADDRVYELSNHPEGSGQVTGNVLATFTARKLPVEANGVFTGFSPHVTSLTDYYPFGSGMEGRTVDGNYRYSFQAQETDAEYFNGAVSFKYRVHDARLGRFLSIDPLAPDYPWNSTYAFSENSTIAYIELEGLEKVSFQTYSFAPFYTFGGGFKGDGVDRQFGDPISRSEGSENFKVGASVQIDLASSEIISQKAIGSLSKHVYFGVEAFSEAHFEEEPSLTDGTFSTHVAANTDAFLWGASADIDIKLKININMDQSTRTLRINGVVGGDFFPANELFITDEADNKIILGVSGADGNPYTSLPGNNSRLMSSFQLEVVFNHDNSFKGVNLGDAFYSVEAWNGKFTSLDPKDGNTSTTVTPNQVRTER